MKKILKNELFKIIGLILISFVILPSNVDYVLYLRFMFGCYFLFSACLKIDSYIYIKCIEKSVKVGEKNER